MEGGHCAIIGIFFSAANKKVQRSKGIVPIYQFNRSKKVFLSIVVVSKGQVGYTKVEFSKRVIGPDFLIFKNGLDFLFK